MPTYDGIGSSVTHEIEVVGDVFISNVEGGSLSTQVPFEIFSNVYGMSPAPTDSRQLRLRVQPTSEASPDDSYVTDMGIQNTTDNYFFITAPQNTSNVGDQNTFVISSTSNVGIGTTDPTSTLHVVGDVMGNGVSLTKPPIAIVTNAVTSISATPTKIAFNNIVTDTHSWFDTTNYRYTPQAPGYYFVTVAQLQINQTGVPYLVAYIYVSGSSVGAFTMVGGPSNYTNSHFNTIVYCNGTSDYIEIFCNTDTTRSIFNSGRLCIHYISG